MWGSLPLLPLRCVLEHLSTEDALAAMSVCRHWRNSILLYEGHKDTLKLRAKQLEKNMFLTRLFRKNTKQLHIYIDCSEDELDKFMSYVLPQYFDTLSLEEVLFIGPSYVQQNQNFSVVKLRRVLTESLVFKHSHCLNKLAIIGCEMDTAKCTNDRYKHKHIEYYSRPLSFSPGPSASDAILSSTNIAVMMYSALEHIILDYDQISTEALETLSHLSMLSALTLNITSKKQSFSIIDWMRLKTYYRNGLDVAINVIALPYKKFYDILENVLVEGLPLVSLKVMFCKTLHTPVIGHVVRLYKSTLRELVWADSPYESADTYHRVVRPISSQEFEGCSMNPFILMCWQCAQLRRLVIHGYWIWQYDIVGFVRLRKSLEQLDISAIYSKQDRFSCSFQLTENHVIRVLQLDTPTNVDAEYLKQVNEFTDFDWSPTPWSALHPGLKVRSTPEMRAEYIVQETTRPLPVASYTD